jgi:membrane protein YqaA with SNARE-associated domain
MKEWKQGLAQIAFVIAVFALVLYFSGQIKQLQAWGYAGVFLISLLSAATVLLPAPGWITVIAMASVLNPYLVGIVAGLGSGLGEITGYMAGDGAAKVIVKDEKAYEKYRKLILKYEMPAVFALAFIPNPLFDVAGIAAGSVEMPIPNFLVACIAGRILRYVLLAYLGAFSLGLFA